MGVLLRAIGTVFALGAAASLADSASAPEALAALLRTMSYAAPTTLATLMLWCAARRSLPPIDVQLQRVVAWLIPGVLASVVALVFGTPGGTWSALAHFA